MKKTLAVAAALLGILMAGGPAVLAQGKQDANTFGNTVRFDKTVHDFGDILVSDGPVKATFSARNIGSKPLVIYNVVSSCGCTDVEWTREPVKPGQSATITATYKNDEGGYPFNKSLTVYISGIKQPVLLRLRGESHAKKLSLGEMYPVRFGNLAFKEVEVKGGNVKQGQQKSGEIQVANLGGKPVRVSFEGVSGGLALKLSQNPVPAGSTATLTYTVTTDGSSWGRTWYYATPVVDGKTPKAVVAAGDVDRKKAAGAEAVFAEPNPELGAGKSRIGISMHVAEDFSSWSAGQKENAAKPIAKESTYSFGKVKAGSKVEASFIIKNEGKSVLKFHKVDSESRSLVPGVFKDVAPGGKGTLTASLDTKDLPKGECLLILTVTTNSPLRPVMNLFVSGWIE